MEFAELNNLASALGQAVVTGLISREEGKEIFKKVLVGMGLKQLPPKKQEAKKK